MKISATQLKGFLKYNKNTGEFFWRDDRGRVRAGQKAGSPHIQGYIQIKIDRVLYRAHRLAWLYVYGEWPIGRLDHKDNRPSNNRIKNLRKATHSQNMANRKLNINSGTGVKGVSARGGKYRAYININGRRQYLGDHSTIKEASFAREAAAKKLHGAFARAA
jgi:hypothetical protein